MGGESTAAFHLTNHFVAYLEDQDMWGVFSSFDIPIKPRSEWYTLEKAIEACKVEEAIYEAKRAKHYASL
jgi:hypothetical protein